MPKPHEIRLGRVKAAVWTNENKENGTTFNTVTITKLFRDDKHWKESSSFGRDDLPLVAKVADLAHSWIFSQQQGEN